MKFILDNMLGKSAKYLRMLGYDTIYPAPEDDETILKLAQEQNRIIITRSEKLYNKASKEPRIVLVRSNRFVNKFRKIIKKLDIKLNKDRLFSRCLLCNTPVKRVDKSAIKDRLPEKVKNHFDNYRTCPNCSKIYWRGGHTERMLSRVKKLFREN
jgi:hypothetical protein